MAIHPLGIIDVSNGNNDIEIINATLNKLKKVGLAWCGYSYSWFANMKARALDGEGAADALRVFAECFCLRNGFHANGDQTSSGKSNYTYRPFTLEGNMAFASAIQEMLLQSHTGVIKVFPAIPQKWKNVSLKSLRAMGVFLVDADMKDGKLSLLTVKNEKGGILNLYNSFGKEYKMYINEKRN